MPTYTFAPAPVLVETTGEFAIGATGVLRPTGGGDPVQVYDMNDSPLASVTVGPKGAHQSFKADIPHGVLDFGSVLLPTESLEQRQGAITSVTLPESLMTALTAGAGVTIRRTGLGDRIEVAATGGGGGVGGAPDPADSDADLYTIATADDGPLFPSVDPTTKKIRAKHLPAAPAADPDANVAGLRTLGTSGTQAAPGNDARFTGYASVPAARTAAFTLVAADVGRLTRVTDAAGVTVTAPTPTSLGVAAGQIVTLMQGGDGQVTVAAGAGVTLSSPTSQFRTRVQFSRLDLIALSGTEWLVDGDTA